ncbi:potassium-transporting ATPase subunit KdpA [Macrococcoides canis]|uniref:Potassium-transporting ATPase potassium-binding subunit n=1 Tax=Macrococcoides canis TaxID=1855823 RepID=A0A1W7A8F0_9STAP|nr:potassium-transporting ATPase subunit KdpA [Macrococcus canis]ARQ05925.1 Potassium-transporting ATPase A chain [Macrococcus canis]
MKDFLILSVLFFLSISIIGYYMFLLFIKKESKLFQKYELLEFKMLGVFRASYSKQSTKEYLFSFIMTNFLMVILTYIVLRTQKYLPFNPNHIENMDAGLAFNTVISFITNTNLQHYAGETGLSYFSQMVVITFLMFTSAGSGFCIALAFIRRLFGNQDKVGNFNLDLTKFILMVLMPLSIVVSLLLVQQGSVQTLKGTLTFKTLEGTFQSIARGPVASLESIKHLGTNGGGFFGANSSTPFENPTIITNITEMISMMLIPGSIFVMFGLALKYYKATSQKQAYYFIGILFAIVCIMFFSNQTFEQYSHISPLNGQMNMEGKEVRFGITQSALFSTITTSFTTGTVNNMHDSQTALGGMIPLILMMMNSIFGGEGVGFLNFFMYVLLTLFIAGLMIGRTPQIFGKKLESKEMKLISLALIIHPAIILGFSALATFYPHAQEAVTNPGAHGLSQILYEYTSSSANNGSGFEGLGDNTSFWNYTTGLAMFLGRFPAMILQLYTASLLAKKLQRSTDNELVIDTPIFNTLLLIIVVIFSALTFLPVLTLGPISEFITR